MQVVIVIPSRYGSTRFPGKPLAPLAGKPLIQWVYERARGAGVNARVLVATDDSRIRDVVLAFGGEVVMTPAGARTGSDRLAHLAETIPADAYINLQGDEVLESPRLLDDLIQAFLEAQPLDIGTLKRAITDPTELTDPNVVKVVTDRYDDALYFSRAPIPHRRDGAGAAVEPGLYYKHLGIYIFRREALLEFARLPTGRLEACEKLEQLRALEQGYHIKVWETRLDTLRIDRSEDLTHAERWLGQNR